MLVRKCQCKNAVSGVDLRIAHGKLQHCDCDDSSSEELMCRCLLQQVTSVFDGGSDVPGEAAGELCTKGLQPTSVKLYILRKEAAVPNVQ